MNLHRNYSLNLFILLAYLSLCVLGLVGPGQLGIEILRDFATLPKKSPMKKVACGGVVRLDVDTATLSDRAIAGFAKAAADDLKTNVWSTIEWAELGINEDSIKTRMPGMMSVITLDKKMYFGTSIRDRSGKQGEDMIGLGYYKDFPPPEIQSALDECGRNEPGNELHRTKANCGEIVAAWIAFKNGATSLKGGRVTSYNMNNGEIADPCGYRTDGETWGCSTFVRTLGLTVIGKGTQPDDPKGLAYHTSPETPINLGIPPDTDTDTEEVDIGSTVETH